VDIYLNLPKPKKMRGGLTIATFHHCVAASTLQKVVLLLVITVTPSGAAWIAPPCSSRSSSSSPFTVSTLQRRGPAGNDVISKWMLPRSCGPPTSGFCRLSTTPALELSPSWSDAATTSVILAESEESWRQFVPLVVSLLVIVDILLGSPAANSVLGLMRPKEEEEDKEGSRGVDDDVVERQATNRNPFANLMPGQQNGNNRGRNISKSKERIDTQAVAQAALDKASATLELRKFLDESKSDWDKMREIQQKMDDDLSKFDENIQRQRTEWEKEVKEIKKEDAKETQS
jgi:hypothetical protein